LAISGYQPSALSGFRNQYYVPPNNGVLLHDGPLKGRFKCLEQPVAYLGFHFGSVSQTQAAKATFHSTVSARKHIEKLFPYMNPHALSRKIQTKYRLISDPTPSHLCKVDWTNIIVRDQAKFNYFLKTAVVTESGS
jgi:hypothetical protein